MTIAHFLDYNEAIAKLLAGFYINQTVEHEKRRWEIV